MTIAPVHPFHHVEEERRSPAEASPAGTIGEPSVLRARDADRSIGGLDIDGIPAPPDEPEARRRRWPRASVVIPAFNEEGAIMDVVREVRVLLGPGSEVLVVDDGSTDQTAFAAAAAGARVVSIPENSGNGAAIKAGIRAATGEVVAFMDADGQHHAEDLGRLLEFAGDYDMVVGARRMTSQASLGRRVANAFYNKVASLITGKKVVDLTSGFRIVRRQVAREMLPLLPNGFSYPTTLTLACFRSGYSVRYVPFDAARRIGHSKIKVLKDGPGFLMIMFKVITLYSPFKVFLALAALPAVLAVAGGIATVMTALSLGIASTLLLNAALVLVGLGFVSEQICAMRFERLQASSLASMTSPIIAQRAMEEVGRW